MQQSIEDTMDISEDQRDDKNNDNEDQQGILCERNNQLEVRGTRDIRWQWGATKSLVDGGLWQDKQFHIEDDEGWQ